MNYAGPNFLLISLDQIECQNYKQQYKCRRQYNQYNKQLHPDPRYLKLKLNPLLLIIFKIPMSSIINFMEWKINFWVRHHLYMYNILPVLTVSSLCDLRGSTLTLSVNYENRQIWSQLIGKLESYVRIKLQNAHVINCYTLMQSVNFKYITFTITLFNGIPTNYHIR
ncbi:Hypothetical_protein [Hexamita inflata]|uniref:Hypothetical_protein n=1 Tax=Hexamita inflata TaxID=28002 RepID=A0AA86TPJ7_9EUKA|nr:Hypothetical protein HINF_LOCUS12479 [Hexamita inflata]